MVRKHSLKKYTTMVRAGLIVSLSFRLSQFVVFVGNIIYLILMYFLWKAIYASSPTEVVNGMTLNDTMIYIVLAAAMSSVMEFYLVWMMGKEIQSGEIVLRMLKPMDFMLNYFFDELGGIIMRFFTTFVPTFIIVMFVTNFAIKISLNILFFLISMVLALLINFSIDFFIGCICLYTHSSWGINIMKEVVVLLLSGATVPLAFFPEGFRKVLECLPFQAIYNVPLTILTKESYMVADYVRLLSVQAGWAVVTITLGRLFFAYSKRVITVNGG